MDFSDSIRKTLARALPGVPGARRVLDVLRGRFGREGRGRRDSNRKARSHHGWNHEAQTHQNETMRLRGGSLACPTVFVSVPNQMELVSASKYM